MNIKIAGLNNTNIRDTLEAIPTNTQRQALIEEIFERAKAAAEEDQEKSKALYIVAWMANDIAVELNQGKRLVPGQYRAYMVIEGNSQFEIAFKLDQLMEAGWQPQGGIAYTPVKSDLGEDDRYGIYHQAVVHRLPHREQENPEVTGYHGGTSVPTQNRDA